MVSVASVIGALAEAIGFGAVLWADCRFLQRCLGIARGRVCLFALVYAGGGGLLWLWTGRYQVSYLLQALVHHLLFLGLIFLMFRGGRGKKLLAGGILLSMDVLVGNFGEAFCSMALLLAARLKNPDPGLVLGEGGSSLADSLQLFLTAAATLALSRRLSKIFGTGAGDVSRAGEGDCPDSFCEPPGRWYVVAAAPLLGFVCVLDVASWGASHGILVRSGGWLGLWYDVLFGHLGICILAALSMLAAGFYLSGMVRLEQEQKKNQQYQAQLLAYRMLEEQWGKTERLRHDMKNHVLALQGLAEEQAWGKLADYLGQMAALGSLSAGREATGNQVVDALLEQKGERARAQGIAWDCQVQIPRGSQIRDIDWCILFGNLLDNALHACGQAGSRAGQAAGAFICLRAGRVKGCFLLEIKNSVEEGSAGTEASGNPGGFNMEPFRGRGIGLLNVRDMVKRCGGTMEAGQREGVYTVSALIPLEPAEQSGQDIRRAV